MTIPAQGELGLYLCWTLLVIAAAVHLGTILVAMATTLKHARPQPSDTRSITIVRPYKGLDRFEPISVRNSLALNGPSVETIFCVADAADPVLPRLRDIIAERPEHTQLLVGDHAISANPKLNNLAKGLAAAKGDLVAFMDAGAVPPPDLPAKLRAEMQPGVGLVSAVAIGTRPENLWARVECAFVNGVYTRLVLAASIAGRGPAPGFLLCFRREMIQKVGLARFGTEPAEDLAASRYVARSGRRISILGAIPEYTGHRSLYGVWSRQLRWAWVRRQATPALYVLDVLFSPWLLVVAASLVAAASAWHPLLAAVLALVTWYAADAALAVWQGWGYSLFAAILRDIMLPGLFVVTWTTRSINWNGHQLLPENFTRAGATRDAA